MKTRVLAALFAAVNLACEEDGRIMRLEEQTDRFVQSSAPKVDILWVVDDSASMGAEQQKIVAEASVFFSRVLDRSLDYHLGFITTDPGERGVLRRYAGPSVEGCDGCRFITRAVPCANPQADVTQLSPEALRTECAAMEVFRALALVGTDGSPLERAFQQVELALGLDELDPATGVPVLDPRTGRPLRNVPAENEGFIREDADLMLIFVSDEEEGLKDFGAPVRYYERLFSLLKARSDQRVLVTAIVGWPLADQGAPAEIPPASELCRLLAPLHDADPTNDAGVMMSFETHAASLSGCVDVSAPNDAESFAEVGRRYIELGCRLGGEIANICAPDYRATLERLSEAALRLGRAFALRRPRDLARGADCRLFTEDDGRLDCDANGSTGDAIDGPICVTATDEDGTRGLVPMDAEQGWIWDEQAEAVTFPGRFLPAPESAIEVRYKLLEGIAACGG